jgi:hypothetical protein
MNFGKVGEQVKVLRIGTQNATIELDNKAF